MTYKNKKIIIGVIVLVMAGAIVSFLTKGSIDMHGQDIPRTLEQLHKKSRIENTPEKHHYLIDGKEIYAREILLADETLFVTAQGVGDMSPQGTVYKIYAVDSETPRLMKEVQSFIPPRTSSEVLVGNLFEKDITNDNIPELFIKVEQSASNLRIYEILKREGNSFVNLTRERDNSSQVDFDEITRTGEYITMTWHAADAIGQTWYELNGTKFVPIQNVGFFQQPGGSGKCEVRVNKLYDQFVVVDTRDCSELGDEFSRYLFTNL